MNARSKVEDPSPLDGFPAFVATADTSNIADLDQLSLAMMATHLNVRALAWMQNTIANAFVDPGDGRDPFDTKRIDLFLTANAIITRALVAEVDYLNDLQIDRLTESPHDPQADRAHPRRQEKARPHG